MPSGDRVSVVSQFGTGPEAGHSIDDDEFYFDYLLGRGYDFVFHAPRYSLERLATSHPQHRHRLRELPTASADWAGSVSVARSIEAPGRQRVIFFGFSERVVLAFLALRPLRRNPLSLVATNNFSARRADLYGGTLRAFLISVRPTLQSMIVHTQFEKDVVLRLSFPFAPRVVVKKHHLMIRAPGLSPVPNEAEKLSLGFFGPAKPEKPLEPVLAMIRADSTGQFNYRLYGLTSDDVSRIHAEFPGRNNLRLTMRMLSRQEYIQEFSINSLVLLSHTREFEGKLSGNLCDCFALGIPYVGDLIEPHLEYERRYGPVGSLQNLDDPTWAEGFLGRFQRGQLTDWRTNLAAAARDFTRESVWASLDEAL
jgi:hypothetical protein